MLNADRVVPVERIVDGLWGDEVPETAVKGVQIYVSRLRKVLPAGRLETKAPGYVLHVEPGELDLARFEDLLTKGREALAAERPAEAARALRDGLGLWRGPALAEFEEPFATPEAARLEELRLTCLELRLEADLALGRHQELAGELESLVTRYPLREGLRAQQLLALYRAGRQAEALHAYQEFRRQLDEELGIEPSQRLRELERRMLQQDPALDTRAAGAHARPESPAVAPAPAEAPRRGTIVGREAELSRLRRLYAESLDGHRQVVFVTGPAGIGKTTLLRSFLAEAEASGALVAHGQCLEQFGAGEAYMPLLEALERLCNGSSAGQLSSLLAERAPAWLEQMPSLRGHLPAASVSAHVNGRPQMLRELSSALEAISAIQPLVVALEDLHWSDPSTVDALNAIARRADPARLLLLATYRPQDARSHPVATLATELMTRGLASDVRLGTLTRRAVVDYLEGRFPAGELPLELGELLHERTTGNPLFLENVVDAWVAGGAIVRVGERWTLRGTVAELSVDVPGTVRQLIESQLDRLDEADQRLVEVASVAGAEFTSAMVASACEQDDLEVEGRLTELAAGGQFVESLGELELTGGAVSARFGFVHALFAEIAYARLSPGRRTRLHRAIGSAIEATSGGGAVPAAELALHFSLGHNPERAIVYFRVAAEQSLARSGHREAVEHLTAALAALDELPAGPDRATAEIPLRIALGSAFMEARGYAAPEVRAAYTRARELCRELGDTEHLKSVLFGLSTIAEVAGDYRDAHALARELLELGEAEGSDEVVASARIALGWPLICMGRFAEARGALEPIADASGSDRMLGAVALVDPAVERLSLLAWTEWFLGRPDKAVSRSTAAVELALEFAPFRRAYALTCDALLRVLRRERAAAADRAEQALALAAEHELPLWSAWATIVAGWASTKNGAHRIELIQSGLEAATATGSSWARTYFLAVLAEVCLEEAQVELGRSTLDGALALAESGDEQFAVPELLRLRAELGLASGATAEAEADLARALEVARGQGARSPELRAAVSLARLQQASGRTGDARLVLSRAYGWFTEGFDTPDLRAAAALLDELGGPLELEQDGVSGTRIVGRESELTQLADRLGQASAGSRRLVFVHGDAGIGKTTLVEALLESVGDDVVVARGQCIEHRGAGEPYLPLLEALGRLGRRPAVKETLARFAPTWLAQLPALLEPDELDTLNARIIGATRERMLRELVDALDELAREQTLVLVLEDLHWADYSTLDLLEALARRNEPARLLVIGTHRPPARSEELQPVGGIARELRLRGLAWELTVGALSATEIDQYLDLRLPGSDAPPVLGSRIRELTGGNPLFVEKVVEAWLETGVVQAREGGFAFTSDLDRLVTSVPRSLRQLIEQRLADLDPGEQELLEAASVAGTEFAAATVAAACDRPDTAVEAAFRRLAEFGAFVESCGEEPWPDRTVSARFRFTHDLCREVLYDRLPAGRRARLHVRIGVRLQAAYGSRAGEIATELASHFVRGHDPVRAVEQLQQAGAQALERSAHREAADHLSAGLELIHELPAGPERDLAELGLRLRLGPALFGIGGWASEEAERTLLRARELAERLERSDELALSLFLLGSMYEVRGDYHRSQHLLESALARPEGPSTSVIVDSSEVLACSHFHQGAFELALDQAETGLGLWDGYASQFSAAYGDDPGVSCHTWAALAHWFLGRPDAAAERAERAVALARSEQHAAGRAFALAQAAMVRQLRAEPAETLELAERAIEAATEGGYTLRVAAGTILAGWARAARGEADRAVAEVGRGIELARSTGARMDDPYYLGLLADARLAAGQPADALSDLSEALSTVRMSRDFFYGPELQRLRGEALLALDRPGDAEAAFEEAREQAARGGSPSLELRASLSLARLRLADGAAPEAAELVLAPYSTFTEGFDTPDLRAARKLLEQVSPPSGELLERAEAHLDLTRARRAPVKYARSGDLNIAYQVTGEGPVDLVLVPGFVSHLEQDWEEPRHARFLDRLGSFARLIRFDKRGTGLSDRPDAVPDLETRMDDLRAVLDVAGSERAVLFGYSEGGPLSILFTATYPERVSALALYGVFAKRLDPDDDYPWAPPRDVRAAYIERLVEDWGIEANMQEMCPSADEAMARWWGTRCRAAASPGAIRALMEMNSLIDVRAILPSIQAPTLVVHRTGDVDTSIEEGRYVAGRIPGAAFSELPGADHFVGIDPDQILDVVEPFVLTVAGMASPDHDRVLATVLMTDIVGSTETLSRVGDRAWADLLARHNAAVKSELERFSGELIDSAGDGILALFDGPSRAIRCGAAIHARLASLGLAVRVGLHTGEIERRPDGVRGIAVHLAARVMAEAGPGDVFVTATTRDLVAGSGLAFADRGKRLLKGIEEPRRLYAVVQRP